MPELVVFICGAATMILELTGSRLLAPYLGTSIIVWTSLIGVMLGCLSVGYWWGGRLSDRKPEFSVFSTLIFVAAILTGGVAVVNPVVLLAIESRVPDLRAGAVLAALVLFGPPSVFLGMVLPYSVRLKTTSVDEAGRTAGALCAVSTVGSIVGTFLAGFVLVAHFGNNQILLVSAGSLIVASLLAYAKRPSARKLASAAVLFLCAFGADALGAAVTGPDFVDANTSYGRVWVYDDVEAGTGRPIRIMKIANESSSAMYLDGNDLVLEYSRYYRLARHFHPVIQKALMIGGAAYSYPKVFLEENPDALLDVVEIDPKVTELARRHFGLRDDPRLGIFHEDGRVYLNRTRERYDVIFGDAFKSIYSLPYQLTTLEATRKIHAALAEDGVVMVNLISAIEGPKGKFLRAEFATFKKVFPQVYVFQISEDAPADRTQNLMLVALKSARPPLFYSKDRVFNSYLGRLWLDTIDEDVPVLTDDHAPVDQYVMAMITGRKERSNPFEKRVLRFLERRSQRR